MSPNWSESGGYFQLDHCQYGALPSREQHRAGSLEVQLRAGKSTCTGMPLSDHLTKPRLLQDSDGNLVPAAEITGPSGSPRQPRVYEDDAHDLDTPRIKCPVAGCLHTFVNRGNLANHKSTKHPGITHIVSRQPHDDQLSFVVQWPNTDKISTVAK